MTRGLANHIKEGGAKQARQAADTRKAGLAGQDSRDEVRETRMLAWKDESKEAGSQSVSEAGRQAGRQAGREVGQSTLSLWLTCS